MQKITTTLILITALFLNILTAQVAIGPRSIATAGTFATQSRGDEAIGWNPANLGLPDNPRFGLRFGILPVIGPFPTVQLNNDLVSVNWFNEWFNKGNYMDAKETSDLLKTFPAEGIIVSPLVSMKLIGMNFGSFAVAITPEILTSVSLPKGYFEFVLKGNEFEEPIDLSDLSVQTQAVMPISFAYGMKLDIPGLDQFVQNSYVGASIKLLAGLAYANLEDFNGQITMYHDRIHAKGDATAKVAVGGFGTAFDVGAAVDLTENMRVNAAFNNLIGFVHWSDSNAEEVNYTFDGELLSSDFEDFDDYTDEQQDSVFNIIDTTFAIDGFNTNYPPFMLIGFEYRNILPALDVYVNYRQDLSEDYYFDVTPRISAGLEYNPLSWLPLRGGIALGGFESFQWGIGIGLKFSHYALDIGYSQDGGLFNHANGFSFSIGQQLLF